MQLMSTPLSLHCLSKLLHLSLAVRQLNVPHPQLLLGVLRLHVGRGLVRVAGEHVPDLEAVHQVAVLLPAGAKTKQQHGL